MNKKLNCIIYLSAIFFVKAGLTQALEPGLYAQAEIEAAHSDNIYRVVEDLAQSDNYLLVSPTLNFVGGYGKQRYMIEYNGDYSEFFEVNSANFYDHELKGEINFEHTLKFSSNFILGYQEDHEEPGSINRVQLDMTEYNKFTQRFAVAELNYGTEASIGLLEFKYRKNDRDYKNNGLDYLDSKSDQYTGTFFFRVAPKTKTYIQALFSDNTYEPAGTFRLDNSFQRYQLGITWNYSSKIIGDIGIGYQQRDYALERLQDIDGLAYNAEINWIVNTYSTLAFVASRESIDSSIEEAGGFLRTSMATKLRHEITPRLKFFLDIGYAEDELVFDSSRVDKFYAADLSFEYELTTASTIGAFYSYEERDSTALEAKYSANSFGINIIISLEN